MTRPSPIALTPQRGPIITNPDAGCLPDPWAFSVPKAAPAWVGWIKSASLLAIIVIFFWIGVHIA